MFDEDIDYYAALGIENPDEGEGAKEADAADQPTEDEQTEGEGEQETAEPAEETDEAEESEQSDNDVEPADDPGRKPKGKKDSVYAAARRRAEAERDREIDQIIKDMGWTDPYTQKPITTKAEYDAYKVKYAEDQKAKLREKSGMTEEEFDKYLGELPEVKEAREAQQKAVQAQIQSQIADEIRQISALDPSVHEVSDVLSGEGGDQIRAYIAKGYTLVDAYKLVHFAELQNNAVAQTRKTAEANAAGKSHLTASKPRGQGMAAVPKETMRWYKAFMPDMTEAEIQKDYNKQLKDTGG